MQKESFIFLKWHLAALTSKAYFGRNDLHNFFQFPYLYFSEHYFQKEYCVLFTSYRYTSLYFNDFMTLVANLFWEEYPDY